MTTSTKNTFSIVVCAFLCWAVWFKFKDANPPIVEPCPNFLETIEVPAFYVGKFEKHQVLRVSHEGRTRGLNCAGVSSCPNLPARTGTLILKVDSCTMTGKANKLMVYEMKLKKADEVELLFTQNKTH